MKQYNEGRLIEVKPGLGWKTLDGRIDVQNKGDKTIFILIYEDTTYNDTTTAS